MMRTHRQSGYTLVELLLYVAMMGILLSAVTIFFGISAEARVKNQTITEVNDQGAVVLDQITQVVRNADSVSAPNIGTSGNSLTVAVPTAASSPTIFNVSSGVMQIKEGSATTVALTNDKIQVTTFSVKNLSRAGTPGAVQISLTMSRVNSVNRNEYDYTKTFTTTVALRP